MRSTPRPAASGQAPSLFRSVPRAAALSVIAAVAVVAILLSGCQSQPAPRIIIPWNFISAGQTLLDVEDGAVIQVATTGAVAFCLDRPGRASVDTVEPQMSSGELQIEAFALARMDVAAKADTDPLRPERLADGPRLVDGACPRKDHAFTTDKPEEMTVLQLRVRKAAGATADAKGFVLHYTSKGRRYQFRLSWTITLCARGDRTTGHCAGVD